MDKNKSYFAKQTLFKKSKKRYVKKTKCEQFCHLTYSNVGIRQNVHRDLVIKLGFISTVLRVFLFGIGIFSRLLLQ